MRRCRAGSFLPARYRFPMNRVRGHNWTEGRLTHDWKPAPSPNSWPDDSLVVRKLWNCSVCGSEIYALNEEKLRDARRRMKVPFDCARALVERVHGE